MPAGIDTRSDPASDVNGVGAFNHLKHWGCDGPLVIEEAGSTTIVPSGWSALLEPHGSILMERVA